MPTRKEDLPETSQRSAEKIQRTSAKSTIGPRSSAAKGSEHTVLHSTL